MIDLLRCFVFCQRPRFVLVTMGLSLLWLPLSADDKESDGFGRRSPIPEAVLDEAKQFSDAILARQRRAGRSQLIVQSMMGLTAVSALAAIIADPTNTLAYKYVLALGLTVGLGSAVLTDSGGGIAQDQLRLQETLVDLLKSIETNGGATIWALHKLSHDLTKLSLDTQIPVETGLERIGQILEQQKTLALNWADHRLQIASLPSVSDPKSHARRALPQLVSHIVHSEASYDQTIQWKLASLRDQLRDILTKLEASDQNPYRARCAAMIRRL